MRSEIKRFKKTRGFFILHDTLFWGMRIRMNPNNIYVAFDGR